MATINTVTLIGRTTRDIEVRTTQSGKSVASFTLAVDGYGKDSDTNFIDLVAWSRAAEVLSEYATKGKQIGVTGRLQTRSYEDKDGNKRKAVEVVVDQFQLLGGNDNPRPDKVATANEASDAIDMSEIPF